VQDELLKWQDAGRREILSRKRFSMDSFDMRETLQNYGMQMRFVPREYLEQDGLCRGVGGPKYVFDGNNWLTEE